jgi:hypothetical protein
MLFNIYKLDDGGYSIWHEFTREEQMALAHYGVHGTVWTKTVSTPAEIASAVQELERGMKKYSPEADPQLHS